MALAFDSASHSTIGGSPSITWNHTVTGSNPLLLVAAYTQPTDGVSSVTYNGTGLTMVPGSEIFRGDGNGYSLLWYLENPATGTHAIIIVSSSSVDFGQAASYTGAHQSSQPDVVTTSNNGTVSSTGTTLSVTTTADNDWTILVIAGGTGGSTYSAGTGSTIRAGATDNADDFGWFDSNGAIHPAGSYSMTANYGVTHQWGAIMVAIKPVFVPPPTNGNFLAFM